MLAVVQDNDQRPSGQVAHDELHGRSRRLRAAERRRHRAERAGHGPPDPAGRGDAGELDQPGAVWVPGAQDGGGLHRQAGLARPARASQRHQPAGPDRPEQLFQLGVPADETAQPFPQITGCGRRGRPDRSRGGCGERRILGQDPGLEFAQGRPGIDAQLAGQAVPDFGVGAQGVALPSGPVQGQDEQLPQPLAQRVLPALRLQLAGQLPVAAQHQVRSGPGFDRHQGQLVQLRPLGVSEAGIGEFGQRLAPPQAKRLAQHGRRLRHLARLRQPPSLRHQLLEADDIDLIGTDRKGIAGIGSDDRARPQGTAQLADLGLQGVQPASPPARHPTARRSAGRH